MSSYPFPRLKSAHHRCGYKARHMRFMGAPRYLVGLCCTQKGWPKKETVSGLKHNLGGANPMESDQIRWMSDFKSRKNPWTPLGCWNPFRKEHMHYNDSHIMSYKYHLGAPDMMRSAKRLKRMAFCMPNFVRAHTTLDKSCAAQVLWGNHGWYDYFIVMSCLFHNYSKSFEVILFNVFFCGSWSVFIWWNIT